ncbi:MAG TPA: DUF4105 domain-containing protein [Sediminispirochaeta sp.]|nr:DUF4105 domain-containing protein [Sediminispirochaeta sp.]
MRIAATRPSQLKKPPDSAMVSAMRLPRTRGGAAAPLLFVLSLFFFTDAPLSGQEWAGEIRLSPQAEVSMVTIYPGEDLYSLFGHTAIRVWDPRIDLDILYNYGQASIPFDANFVPRFVRGDLPFMLGVNYTQRAYDFYKNVEDRGIYEQKLNLTTPQRQEIFDFLAHQARRENREYIYDYFFDNCTTRVRDLFKDLFDEELELPVSGGGESFREQIAPYLEGLPFVAAGINLLFGPRSDRPPQPGEGLYLPFQLRDAVEEARLAGVDRTRPLVSQSRMIYRQGRTAPQAPSLGPGTVGTALLLLSLLFTLTPLFVLFQHPGKAGLAERIERLGRVYDTVLFVFVGLLGIAMVLLWIFSGYVMTYWNLNLLWAWPVHLLVPALAVVRRRVEKLYRYYFDITAVVALLFLFSAPFLPQRFPLAAYLLAGSIFLRAGGGVILSRVRRRRRLGAV